MWATIRERILLTPESVGKLEGGSRIVHAAQHLHGGVGVDRDYPVHRCFTYSRQLELSLGGPTQQLLTIGRMLANEPAPAD